jgi:nicotinate-nucleotide pyrophosphorylase (carboxylating)
MSLKEVTDFLVKLALAEDVGRGDVTACAVIAKEQKTTAVITAKEAGVIAGLSVAADVFRHVDPRIRFSPKVKDGAAVKRGTVIAVLTGPARGIVTGERTALNFLQHLSGVATTTNKFIAKVKSQKPACRQARSKVKILDTRKTTPGLRLLEKYAVQMGGGMNHRLGLYDAILIKDNHIKLAGGIEKAIEKVRGEGRGARRVEVEAKTINEVQRAIAVGVDRILLDNMSPKMMRAAVKLCEKAGIKTEASGGINLSNVAAVARTGVYFISIGALTHSAKALDINLKII